MRLLIALAGVLLVGSYLVTARPFDHEEPTTIARMTATRDLLLAADPFYSNELVGPADGEASAAAASQAISRGIVVASSLKTSDFELLADTDCIKEPVKFMEAWRSPNPIDRDRCVDNSIIVRIAFGNARFGDTLSSVLSGPRGFFNRLTPLSFWAFKDAPEKYLRIGVPRSVGAYVDGVLNHTTNTQDENEPWSSKLFPGVRKKSNGVSFLQQIGFGADFYVVENFWMIFVAKRDQAVLDANKVPTFVPTWENVRRFYQDYIREYIKNNTPDNPADFSIPEEVVKGGAGFRGLSNIDLSELTGCPSQCTFEDRNYPDPVGTVNAQGGTASVPALTPGIFTNHTQNGRCAQPVIKATVTKKYPNGTEYKEQLDVGRDMFQSGRLRLGEPTGLAKDEYACTNRDWKRYYLLGDYVPTKQAPYPPWVLTDNKTPRFEQNGKPYFPGLLELCRKEGRFPGPLFMNAFLDEWNKLEANDFRRKAILFRAALMTKCIGNFNEFFSGNGLVYTGHGGLFSSTVHEVLLGGISGAGNSSAEEVINKNNLLGDYAYSFFCLDGTDSCCPNKDCKAVSKPGWE